VNHANEDVGYAHFDSWPGVERLVAVQTEVPSCNQPASHVKLA
jgi:hypothetical protein